MTCAWNLQTCNNWSLGSQSTLEFRLSRDTKKLQFQDGLNTVRVYTPKRGFPRVSFQPSQIDPSCWHHENHQIHASSLKQACYQETTLDKWFFTVWEIPQEEVSRSSYNNYFYISQSPSGCWLPRITGGKEAILWLSLRNWTLSKFAMGQMLKSPGTPTLLWGWKIPS